MKNRLKLIGKILVSIILVFALIIGSYVIYVYAQYHRLPNDMKQTIKNPQTQQVELGQTYKMMTFNIGYGSYPPSFNFFMDGGDDVRAYSKSAVKSAIQEDIRLINKEKPDFGNIQEIDWQGDRSQQVNEPQMVRAGLPDYSSVLT